MPALFRSSEESVSEAEELVSEADRLIAEAEKCEIEIMTIVNQKILS